MEKTIDYFKNMGFKGADLDKIIAAFSLKDYKKGDFFIKEGKISKHLGFVESGMFQYYVLKDGEEKTTYISTENTFIASLSSFINEKPARESVQALTDGQISLLAKTDLKQLVNDLPQFKNFYLGLLESAICSIDDTRTDLIVLTAEQRYEKMLTDEPHLLQRIPLQYLASILGVTPRHLSRIRKNIR
jgi:CRP/FNR family transcriptional regulator, anaerobic regulatory protein